MMISNNKTISMTEAGQNVSTVRCVPQEDSHQTASDEEVLAASAKLMERNKHVYEELSR
ncbi:MAG: hypothetical protein SOH60_01940 [Lachnospiraceae bacterium]|jgi:nitrogenase subunit NifH